MTKNHFSNLQIDNQRAFNLPLQPYEDASEMQIDLRMQNYQELGFCE